MAHQFANWPPNLTAVQQEQLRQHAIDWATTHGLLMRTAADNATAIHAVHVPFALFPSPYPKQAFERVSGKMQQALNRLVHRVAIDPQFLRSVFDPLSKVDEFTGKLYAIWKRLYGPTGASAQDLKRSSISLGLHRTDYMLHQSTTETSFTPQMIELNTISVSFSSLTHLVGDLHRTNYFNDADPNALDVTSLGLPANQSLFSLAEGLWEAWRLYGASKAVVVMIVQPAERNAFDQRWIEYNLYEAHGVRLIRKTMQELANELLIDPSSGVASLKNGGEEIAVVYYRAGYGPGDYPSETEWQTRERLEKSMAIKCPTIAYQLVGAKKVQQVLALPGVLERFVNDQADLALIRSSFTGIYPLDNSALGKESYQRALDDPERFVLKPQREGGGNNFYGQQVRSKLLELSPEDRSAYILMDRIQPAPFKNVLVRNGEAVESSVVSELGVYGVYLADDQQEYVNRSAGHLLRTKMASNDEGGVATGFAVVDSPLLF